MNPVFPSILATNFFDLEAKLRAFEEWGIEVIHLDVMDGHFVDTISFGPSMAKAIKEKFPFRLDAHLMVSNPEQAIPHFLKAGVDWLSFHAEAAGDTSGLLQSIHDRGCRAGLVLNPDTPLERLFPFLHSLDYVLLMSVFPGYGGQAFIPNTLERVVQMKNAIAQRGSGCLLQVDGGINTANAALVKEAGADLIVVGTSLFNAADIKEKVGEFANLMHWSRP
jgi:ribulose-phosphate 3-epimerase